MTWKGEKQRHQLSSRGISTTGKHTNPRGSAFQMDTKEYGRRRYRSVPLVEVTTYNKRKLAKANIWYTSKIAPNGEYMIHVLPEDLDKINVRPNKWKRVSEEVIDIL